MISMLQAMPWRHLAMTATFASVTVLTSPGWAQTRSEMSQEENAAGVRPSATQLKAEDQELKQIDQSLMRQEQPTSPAQPAAPK
jgi:hypothetical protein